MKKIKFLSRSNKILTTLLVGTLSFSIIGIAVATAPNPGHNFTEVSGGIATGDIIYGSATDVFSALADVGTGNALISGGVSTAPEWGKIGLTTHVDGTLPIGNGGTGLTTLTDKNVILGAGGSTPTFVAPGSAGNLLESDGTTWVSAAGGVLTGDQIFTTGTAQTYTPTSGTNSIVVQMWGGGGAGGSCADSAGCAAGGGGSGGYALYYLTGVSGTYTYSVGAGGTAVTDDTGNAGGNSTFVNGGTTVTAFGGAGGTTVAGSTVIKFSAGGAGGVISTYGTINGAGTPGGNGMTSTVATTNFSGNGGSTALGGGGIGVGGDVAATAIDGNAAIANTGSGGSGARTGTTTASAGGAGADGLIIIWEYR